MSIETTPVTVVSTETLPPSLLCGSACELDVTATIVTFPGQITTVTEHIPATSVDVYVISHPGDGNSTSTSTTILTTVPPAAPVTWVYEGVTLCVYAFLLLKFS